MTKNEFLGKLREALANDLTGPIIQENVDYYSDYIRNETSAGRDENEVVAELGDPWMLARTIIDTTDSAATGQNNFYGKEESPYSQGAGERRLRPAGTGAFRLLVALLGIIGIIFVIVTVVGGIISLIAPIVVPLLAIMIVIRFINQRR